MKSIIQAIQRAVIGATLEERAEMQVKLIQQAARQAATQQYNANMERLIAALDDDAVWQDDEGDTPSEP